MKWPLQGPLTSPNAWVTARTASGVVYISDYTELLPRTKLLLEQWSREGIRATWRMFGKIVEDFMQDVPRKTSYKRGVIIYNPSYSTHLFAAIYRTYDRTPFITGRGSSCGRWMDLLRVARGKHLGTSKRFFFY